MSDIVIRLAAESDLPLIYSSWCRGAHEAHPANLIPSSWWTRGQNAHVARCLSRPDVRTLVAVRPDDPATVLGFICAERPGGSEKVPVVVHWIYVQRLVRERGVGRELAARAGIAGKPVVFTTVVFTQASKHLGWIHAKLADRGVRLAYDPYLVGP